MTEFLFHLRGVSYGYAAEQPILTDVNLHLVAGERVGLTGHNGSGKTTLLHLMVGLHKPHAGEIHAFGRRRETEADYREVRAKAGLLFQDPDDQLFCPTVAEDIAFGPLNLGHSRETAHRIARDTLMALNLEGFEGRITYQLSGGEKRLVSLATVLAMQPEVLLLDEPTNALDAKTRAHLTQILQTLPQAMVIVSHDANFLDQLVTRMISLEEGELVSG